MDSYIDRYVDRQILSANGGDDVPKYLIFITKWYQLISHSFAIPYIFETLSFISIPELDRDMAIGPIPVPINPTVWIGLSRSMPFFDFLHFNLVSIFLSSAWAVTVKVAEAYIITFDSLFLVLSTAWCHAPAPHARVARLKQRFH